MRWVMDTITMIEPLHVRADQSAPDRAVRSLDALIGRGMGRGLVEYLHQSGTPLLTTFYAIAVIADRAGLDGIYCVPTDADIHRVWAPVDGSSTRIRYLAPSSRVVRRLQAYGVPEQRIRMTGFPLPLELLGEPDLEIARRNLARRLLRLDPRGVFHDLHRHEVERMVGLPSRDAAEEPPLLTFAVGGAGAQTEMVDVFLPSLRDRLRADGLRLTLVAGTRPEVHAALERSVERAGLDGLLGSGIRILFEPEFEGYYRRFNQLLAETDVLWSKPSELSFYAALGIPLVLSKPLGAHERFNRRWLREIGAGFKQRSPVFVGGWLQEWLHDGTLAAAAWSGFIRLPKGGTHAIRDEIARSDQGG